MTDAVELFETPEAEEMYMILGWRQWADAGSVSSGLPLYLIKQLQARKIGLIRSKGFYLFQIPGTHGLLRPVISFEDGFPESLEIQQNELYYAPLENGRGLVILLGDEPHMDIERYSAVILQTAKLLKVKRIVSLGGVYGEVPYDKERSIGCIYSLESMKAEISRLAVNLSDYHGGASIGSYICQRASQKMMQFVGFYAFAPLYDFSGEEQSGNTIRIENDYMSWLGVMRRLNYMLKLELDLSDLEHKSRQLVDLLDARVAELDEATPELAIGDYMRHLSEEFSEQAFEPLDEFWEEELRRLFDKMDTDDA